MAQRTVKAPLNQHLQQEKALEALKKKSSRTPQEQEQYVQVLEARISRMEKAARV